MVRVIMLWLLSAIAAADSAGEYDVLAGLLSRYGSRAIRPGIVPSGGGIPAPTQVQTQIYIDQMMPLNMIDSTFGFDGYLRLWWTDPRLAFNGTADGGITDSLDLKHQERQRIWKPDLYWEGAQKLDFPHTNAGFGEMLTVGSAGNVFWSRQSRFLLSCHFGYVELNTLPFDTHNCWIQYGMYAEDASQVQLAWKADSTALLNWQGACLADWYVTRFEQEDLKQVYLSGNYTYAKATLSYTRSSSIWIWSYLVPALTMCFISYLGFFIDSDATPARVALGIITILVCLTNFLGLLDKLPPTVDPPWLARFILISFFFNVVALAEQVIMSYSNSTKKWLDEQHRLLDSQVADLLPPIPRSPDPSRRALW